MALDGELFDGRLRSALVNTTCVWLYFGLHTVRLVSYSEVQRINVSHLGPERLKALGDVWWRNLLRDPGPSGQLIFATDSEMQLLAGYLRYQFTPLGRQCL